jgi:hypothetical protein
MKAYNFTYQLKEFKQIVKKANLAKHNGRRIIYVANHTLHAFWDSFCLKFRLENNTRSPVDGFHYLSQLSLKSLPIKFPQPDHHWFLILDKYLNQITWEDTVTNYYTWKDYHNCCRVAATNRPEFCEQRQITFFIDKERQKFCMAGLGGSRVLFDPAEINPWDFVCDRVVSTYPLDSFNLGDSYPTVYSYNQSFGIRTSEGNNYLQLNSYSISLTLANVIKTEVSYYDVLSLMPNFDHLSCDVRWRYYSNSCAYLYKYDIDGICYILDQEHEVIDEWKYILPRSLPFVLKEPIYLYGDDLEGFAYQGLTLALDLQGDKKHRTHGLVNRDRLFRPFPVSHRYDPQDRRLDCKHYDTRVLGSVTEALIDTRQLRLTT